MTDNANPRWRLAEKTGKMLVLVKDFVHTDEVRPPTKGKMVAVEIRANGIAFYARPSTEQWPPCDTDLLIVFPTGAVTIDNLEDLFPARAAAEIYHSFRLNRRHLIQLVVDNTSPTSECDRPGKPKRKEV
ncbi:hypothetical protein [Geobacter sp. AOG1]|uniref:hypothetical protein n=1 Tax=Geobacter sp. AOG1 TaxID=1566346 RepID=UPI001CC3FE7B|nr:hypothetical protein [Geobacter sp. AOG1]GFE56728.1 hypothetical protein AOG1_06070 [Geobacter sp. AOG1]